MLAEVSDTPSKNRRARAIGLVAVLCLGVAIGAPGGCATTDLSNRGGPCTRASDCAAGLACVDGVCSDDLSRLDAGSVPNLLDTGTPPDAPGEGGDAPTDAPGDGKPPADSGDTGTPPTDTGTPPTDTGTPPTDTGTPPTDTGTPPTDTGTAPTDTGSSSDGTAG